MGGENSIPAKFSVSANGSSPRGRGKQLQTLEDVAALRLIPAWAGKTSRPCSAPAAGAAHPRVGGENLPNIGQSAGRDGSSPRGRGKPHTILLQLIHKRLIPAWAGKTVPSSHTGSGTPAHPRVGGENRRRLRFARAPGGSSPRGRGKRLRRQGGRVRHRLIPAWAGKTSTWFSLTVILSAHPRVGGENRLDYRDASCGPGSSPRGRGKRHPVGGADRGGRLIPAWAGKT